jgi:hypothetical protein
MAEGSLTLPGDFDTVALKTAPQDALHGPIEGRARVLLCGLNAHLGSFRHSPARGHGRGLRFHHLQPGRAQRHNLPPLTAKF